MSENEELDVPNFIDEEHLMWERNAPYLVNITIPLKKENGRWLVEVY